MNVNEIIEMEVLNGIDRAFHANICEKIDIPVSSIIVESSRLLAENLKEMLPKYIDEVLKTIESRFSP